VIDTTTRQISHRIAVGKHPFGLALSKNGNELYVVNVISNSVSVINTTSLKSETINVGDHPYCVTPSKDGLFLFVTNTQDDSVSVIELAKNKALQPLKLAKCQKVSARMS